MPGFSTHLIKNRRPPEIAAFMASLRRRNPYKRPCDEMKTIFVHVPKAAGTSVALSLFGEKVFHFPARYYRQYDRQKFDSYFKFTIVRDPVARFLSAYSFLKAGGVTVFDERFRDRWLADYDRPEDLVDKLYDEVVNDRLSRLLDWGHLAPQCDYVCHNGQLLVDYVGRVETIEADFQEICQRIGIRAELQHLNRGPRQDRPAAHRFGGEHLEKLRVVYAEDFKTFGY